jgi:hypothetical protein
MADTFLNWTRCVLAAAVCGWLTTSDPIVFAPRGLAFLVSSSRLLEVERAIDRDVFFGVLMGLDAGLCAGLGGAFLLGKRTTWGRWLGMLVISALVAGVVGAAVSGSVWNAFPVFRVSPMGIQSPYPWWQFHVGTISGVVAAAIATTLVVQRSWRGGPARDVSVAV